MTLGRLFANPLLSAAALYDVAIYGVAGMECCGICCGDEDREYWMNDRISPKIGLSDDDLLDFQSDEGEVSPTPVVHHIHRNQRSRRSAGGGISMHESSTSHARARKKPSKSFERLGSQVQGDSGTTSHREKVERGPSKSIRSGQSLQVSTPAAPPPSTEAGAPRTAPEETRAAGPAPTKLAALTAEEKEEEKKRLQALVKEFAREAVSGFEVRIVNSETGTQSDARFAMDRFLTGVEIRSSDEATAPSVSLKMQNVKGIFKGDAAAARSSDAVKNVDQGELLLLETVDGQSVPILAPNQPKRDKVYTCLKILSDSRGLETRQQLQRAEQMIQNPSGTIVPETQSVCTTQRISEGNQGGSTGHEAHPPGRSLSSISDEHSGVCQGQCQYFQQQSKEEVMVDQQFCS